ncbi:MULTISPECIES: hypothetical protein [Klebsiella]|uniref:hypothetical protein n=1 Tax=Klebsiella TaxID=570 RepID=UPI00066588D7|nr:MULTISPECIES: hypothetical protein [Klebsiella]ELO7627400.1 hypothetical protein [Klebsiella michiganensis]MDR6617397.1 hypothetical protein [Klebsiella sp. 1400]DAF66414.1 MAG TPA: hypothetical protein [Caudoviricetes sp.]
MPSSAVFVAACTAFINAVNFLTGHNREQAKLTSNAIKHLTMAIHETEIYFSEREEGLERDLAREKQLSRYWSEAAEPLRPIDLYFSDLCAMKAQYWLFPNRYERETVRELNITLEGMRANLQKLRRPE